MMHVRALQTEVKLLEKLQLLKEEHVNLVLKY